MRITRLAADGARRDDEAPRLKRRPFDGVAIADIWEGRPECARS
jgi:hypothetical protein